MSTPESEALDRADMERLVAGEDAALNRLMERHATGVFQFLFRLVGNEDDANDLAQETFVRVYESRRRYDPAQSFATWLFTIAANLGRNQIRWRYRHPQVSLDAQASPDEPSLGESLPSQASTPQQEAEARERAGAVRAAVWELPEDLREALVLCEWEELSVAEAAARLESTPKAVESRLFRARKSLRQTLQKWF
jgi:RNA polymerase sigma-70 factor (ECF subfamily)